MKEAVEGRNPLLAVVVGSHGVEADIGLVEEHHKEAGVDRDCEAAVGDPGVDMDLAEDILLAVRTAVAGIRREEELPEEGRSRTAAVVGAGCTSGVCE